MSDDDIEFMQSIIECDEEFELTDAELDRIHSITLNTSIAIMQKAFKVIRSSMDKNSMINTMVRDRTLNIYKN
jgi:hypothetical protein